MKNMRPMPKELLKKRLLKVLYESKKRLGHYIDIRGLLRVGIAKSFSIKALTDEEYRVGGEAVKELASDNYIERIPDAQYVYRLTKKGLSVANKRIEDMKLPSVRISNLDIQLALLRKIYNNYQLGDFEDVVFKAFKHLEERVREKAKLSASVIGVELMTQAFHEKTGKLRCPLCVDESERHGLHMMYRGAVAFFKNPTSHRTVIYDDPNKIFHILGFVNFLLDMLDQSELVDQKK